MNRITSVAACVLVLVSPSLAGAGEALGKITSFKANVVTISLKDSGPEVKKECELFKRFETKLGSFKAKGWLDIAKVVVEVAGSVMKVKIVEQKSKMTVNGKPVNHFKAGTEVKLTWR